jgi:hypothetical protein
MYMKRRLIAGSLLLVLLSFVSGHPVSGTQSDDEVMHNMELS